MSIFKAILRINDIFSAIFPASAFCSSSRKATSKIECPGKEDLYLIGQDLTLSYQEAINWIFSIFTSLNHKGRFQLYKKVKSEDLPHFFSTKWFEIVGLPSFTILYLLGYMLTKTFSHIEGVTPSVEKHLREKGIHHWDDFLKQIHLLESLPQNKLEKIKHSVQASKDALSTRNLAFFKNLLKSKEYWRLSSMGKIGYVDIETTGLSRWYNEITLIGIYDGIVPHLYVNGKNLHEAKEKLQEFDIVVTFNGKQFDIPFIEHHFSHKYDFIHLDLRYMLKELGLQGGLKNIEIQLGIQRDADLSGIVGFEAVRLWHQYKRGNQNALQKLLRYNEQDIVNLKTLLQYYLDKKQVLHDTIFER